MTAKAILAAAALGLGLCKESQAADFSGSATLNSRDKKIFTPLKKTDKLGVSDGKIDSAINGVKSSTPAQFNEKPHRAGQKKESPPSPGNTSPFQPSAQNQKTPSKKYANALADPEIAKKICPPGSPPSCDAKKLTDPPSIDNLLKEMPKGTSR